MNRFSVCFSYCLLIACTACSSVQERPERQPTESTELADEARTLNGELSAISGLLGVWKGNGQFYLPKNLKPPQETSQIEIGAALNGLGVMICERTAKSCSNVSIGFRNSKSHELRVTSYRPSSRSNDTAEVDFAEAPLSLKKDVLSWTSTRDVESPIQPADGGVRKHTSNQRYSYSLKAPNELYFLIESSEDGKRWQKFFDITYKREL